jgi:hypothetical protein
MTAAAVEDSGGGRRWRQWTTRGRTTMAALDNKGTQDWVADYNGEGTTVSRDAGDSGVAMMAATVEDGCGKRRRRQRTKTVADNDGGG